jgi:uridylate kinase
VAATLSAVPRSPPHGGIEEVTGHYMGMLGTVINALAVQDTLELDRA